MIGTFFNKIWVEANAQTGSCEDNKHEPMENCRYVVYGSIKI